jgi:ribonucleoside-diphosphate reductase alpha chain
MNNFAIAISIGLQYACRSRNLSGLHLHPLRAVGLVEGNDAIKMSTSMLDYIFRELAISYSGAATLPMSSRPIPA